MRRGWYVLALLLAAPLQARAVSAPRIIAVTRFPADGFGRHIVSATGNDIDDEGTVVVSGLVSAQLGHEFPQVWIRTHAHRYVLAQRGDPAPGTDGTFWDVTGVALSDAGHLLIRGTVKDPQFDAPLPGDGYWISDRTTIRKAARAGDAALPAFGDDATLYSVLQPAVATDGTMHYCGGVQTLGREDLVRGVYDFAFDESSTSLAVGETLTDAAGMLEGEVAASGTCVSQVGRGGMMAAVYRVTNGEGASGDVLFAGPPGALAVVARGTGIHVAGALDVDYVHIVTINDAGGVLFDYGVSHPEDPDTPGPIVVALRSPDGSVRTILQTGDPTPGIPGGVFGSPSALALNGAGHAAVLARYTHPVVGDRLGIWSEGGSGVLHRVAAGGEPAPGFPPGVAFFVFSAFEMNAAGQIAFDSTVDGPIPPDLVNDGVWAEADPVGHPGELTLVIKEGARIDVGDGTSRIIAAPPGGAGVAAPLKGHGGETGAPRGLSANGEVLLVAKSTTLDDLVFTCPVSGCSTLSTTTTTATTSTSVTLASSTSTTQFGTTTTTLAPACAGDAACADDDPCTTDRCAPTEGCRHEYAGFDGVACVVHIARTTPPCAGAVLGKVVATAYAARLRRIDGLLAAARAAGARRRSKLVARATRELAALDRAVTNADARKRIDPACRDEIRDLVSRLRPAITTLLE